MKARQRGTVSQILGMVLFVAAVVSTAIAGCGFSTDTEQPAAVGNLHEAPGATLPVELERPIGIDESPLSPDGQWVVRTVSYEPKIRDKTGNGSPSSMTSIDDRPFRAQYLVAIDGSITNTILVEQYSDGLGGSTPQFLGWHPDSKAAYVFSGGAPDGCGSGGWSDAIKRVDTSGTIRVVGSGPGLPSMAPNGKRIGYATINETASGELIILDAESGQEDRLSFAIPDDASSEKSVKVGGWSPTSDATIVDVGYDTCDPMWRNSLILVHLATRDSEILVKPQSSMPGLIYRVTGWGITGVPTVEASP